MCGPRIVSVIVQKHFLLAALVIVAALRSEAGVHEWTRTLAVPEQWEWSSHVAIDPTNPELAYAATSAGVFKTNDGGNHWALVDSFPNAAAVAINPEDSSMVVTGNYDYDYPRATRFRRSEDGGSTWEERPPLNHYEQRVMMLAFDPSQPATVYAALQGSGVAKSTDGGKTWVISDWKNGLACCLWDFYDTLDLAVSEGPSPTIYVAAYGAGLFLSTDQAVSWQNVTIPSTSRYTGVFSVAVDPTDPRRLYIIGDRTLTSADGGQTWEPLPLPRPHAHRITVDPHTPTTLYVASPDGVFRSTDRGSTWIEFNDGLGALGVGSIAIDRTGSLLYATTEAGIFVYKFARSSLERLPEDRERLPRLIREVINRTGVPGRPALAYGSFVLPAAGNVRGAQGQRFVTEASLVNSRPAEQAVILAWLPQGNTGGSEVPMYRIQLPAASGDALGILTIEDLAAELRVEGLGSIMIIAIDDDGDFDDAAAIDGSARIWSPPGCGAGAMSQSLQSVPARVFGGAHRARATGFRQNAAHRTNVGIVNLGEMAREFTVTAAGEKHAERFTISVPPFSLVQTGVPAHDFGSLALTVTSDGSGPWTAYGSSVDNVSGDSWAAVAEPTP